MTLTIEKNGKLKKIQSEDLVFYQGQGWKETKQTVFVNENVKKGKKRYFDEEGSEEE
jgi:hypothetical protein